MYKIGYLYIILNTISNKFYLGSTENLKVRKAKHFRDLKNGKHHSVILQRAWNKYGESAFEFIIIETTTDYKEREDYLLKNIIDLKDSYNVARGYGGGDLISNHPNRDVLISNAIDVLRRAKRPERKYGEDNPNWRGGISKSKCNICGKEIRGHNNFCSSCYFKQRDINGEKNPFFGKKHTKETIEKLKNRELNYYPSHSKKINIKGEVYSSFKEAERKIGVKAATIAYRCKSNNILFKDYNIVGEEKNKNLSYKNSDKVRKRRVVCDDILFESIKEATIYFNCSSCKIIYRANSENFKNWYFYES